MYVIELLQSLSRVRLLKRTHILFLSKVSIKYDIENGNRCVYVCCFQNVYKINLSIRIYKRKEYIPNRRLCPFWGIKSKLIVY